VFDHNLSQLESVAGETAAPPVAAEPAELAEPTIADIPITSAAGLAALLASTESVRQAIVLNEILHRPEERWG
jgi:hypothetical protein